MKKKIIALLLITSNAFSQNQPLIDFETSKKNEFNQKIKIYEKEKNDWSKYLSLAPNLNYDAINKSISVGLNLSNYSRFLIQEKRNKIEIEKLKLEFKNNLDQEINSLELNYFKIQSNIEIIKQELKNLVLMNELFQIKKKKFENNQINLESWISVKQNFLKVQYSIENKIRVTEIEINNYIIKTKTSEKIPEVNILKSLSANLKDYSYDKTTKIKSFF